jgi:NAD-dependent deacetylase
VVLFGEWLPPAAVEALDREPGPQCGLVFSVGTSSRFPYISGLILEARARGISCVEINPEPTELSPYADTCLRLGAEAALTQIWEAVQARRAG